MFEYIFPIFCFGVVVTGIVVKGLITAADMSKAQITSENQARAESDDHPAGGRSAFALPRLTPNTSEPRPSL